MMSKENEDVKDKFSNVLKASDSETEFSAISSLTEQTERGKVEQKEERLLWVITLIIFFDILFLKECHNWSLPLIVGVLEIAIIFVLAHKWSVKTIELLFNMVYESFKKK